MITVYHDPESRFDDTKPLTIADVEAGFRKVALVDTVWRDDAFERTNTIDGPWWTNDRVTALVGPCRSTSVGDVMKDGDGRYWLCAGIGWRELTT